MDGEESLPSFYGNIPDCIVCKKGMGAPIILDVLGSRLVNDKRVYYSAGVCADCGFPFLVTEEL